jgi:hypothetical protein
MTAKCDRCGKSNAVRCERTNPRDYSVELILLCGRCRNQLGIKPPAHLKLAGATAPGAPPQFVMSRGRGHGG